VVTLRRFQPLDASKPGGYSCLIQNVRARCSNQYGASRWGSVSTPGRAGEVAPLVNTSPLLAAATMALEMIWPMPGALISRRPCRANAAISSVRIESAPVLGKIFDQAQHARRQRML
jgi:hypothetical protein